MNTVSLGFSDQLLNIACVNGNSSGCVDSPLRHDETETLEPLWTKTTTKISFIQITPRVGFFIFNFVIFSPIFQCRRRVRRHPHDQGPPVSHRANPLGAPRHLQVVLLHRRHLLPVRPAELQDEVRLVDVRPRQDRPGALRDHGGPEGGSGCTDDFFLRFFFWFGCQFVRVKALSTVHTCSFPKVFVQRKDAS